MIAKEVKIRSIRIELSIAEAVALYKATFSGTDSSIGDELSEQLGSILTTKDIDNE